MVQKKTSNTYFTKNRESLIDEKSKHGILNPKGKLNSPKNISKTGKKAGN